MGENNARILADQKARSAASKERVERNPKVSAKTMASTGGTTGIKRRK
ncbi:hypothetical protein HZB00_01165 [Candidatus Woesearchaeota archaeon]|nr:hypothetical protein [Candidatus Woesearchaeota archaeon]